MTLALGPPTPVRIGEVLADRYRVESVLGTGGMGVVFAAVDLSGQRRVAIKLLNAAAEQNAEFVSRFLREGRAASRLESDHVARVLDCGTLADGRPYLVTELLEGTDLARLLREQGALDVGYTVDLVMQTCQGLAEAHAAGIVHRDLKPANLFLTSTAAGEPLVKILDFGICKLANDDGATSLTAPEQMLGTPKYMSPEQLLASRDIDPRSDVWAVGVILYELLTAHPPFNAPSLVELMNAILGRTPPPLHMLRANVPPALSALALRCLAKSRVERVPDVGQLLHELSPFCSRAQSIALSSTIASQPPASAATPVNLPQGGTKLLAPNVTAMLTPTGPRQPPPHSSGGHAVAATPVGGRVYPVLPNASPPVAGARAPGSKRGTVWFLVLPCLALAAVILVGPRFVPIPKRAVPPPPSASIPPSTNGPGAAEPAASVEPATTIPPAVTVEPAHAPAAPPSASGSAAPGSSAKAVAPRQKQPSPSGTDDRCSPPYVISETGKMIWKRECFK
jgi:serine/threonine-protein kinase